MTPAEPKADFKFTTDTPYFALTGELWGLCCEDLGENWPRYFDTILYFQPLCAVFRVFAIWFVASAWSIRVSFVGACLIWIDMKWSIWEIRHTHLIEWNPRMCFQIFAIGDSKAVSLKFYYGFNIKPYRLYMFLYIKDALKPQRQYAETLIFVMFSGQWQQKKNYPGFIVFPQKSEVNDKYFSSICICRMFACMWNNK